MPSVPPANAKRQDARLGAQPGLLSVLASPRSWVTIGTRTKATPETFQLAPGTYLVKIHSDETGVTKYEPITIAAGDRKQPSVPMTR